MFIGLSTFFILLIHLLTGSIALLEFSSYSSAQFLILTSVYCTVGEEFPHGLSAHFTDSFLCYLILHNPFCQFLGSFDVLLAVQKVLVYSTMPKCGNREEVCEEKWGPAKTNYL